MAPNPPRHESGTDGREPNNQVENIPGESHEGRDNVHDENTAARTGLQDEIGTMCLAEGKCTTATERKEFIEKNIQNLPKMSELLGGIDQIDLAKLTPNTLIKLEDQYPGILLYAFTDIIEGTEKVDFTNWELYKTPVAGQKLKVDFRENSAANNEIGAADILPPAVRCITVYTEGDPAVARTSERRIGLKGRNKNDAGFFDKEGYIPIFTNDVIIVGGETDAEKNIDLEYEKPFLTEQKDGSKKLDEESYGKYEESGEGRKDKEFMERLIKENPQAALRKNLTKEEIQTIEARNTAAGINGNIVKTALMVAKNGGMGLKGEHCWDWSDKIYRMAGVTGKYPTREIFSYTKEYPGKDCKPYGKHATEEQYGMIRPGDWIYYNNRNKSDAHGNHSAIFIEWADRDKKLAIVASGSANIPWRIHPSPVDFNDKPVTQLGKPSQTTGNLPDIEAIEAKYRQDKIPPAIAV